MRGCGVRAFCELEFSLSDCVKSFRTGVGIDMRAGKGGCALGRGLLRDYPSLKETSVYSSDLLGAALGGIGYFLVAPHF